MLKKFLAGLTAIVLSLGMVALTAGPASAHHNTIKASVACNTEDNGYWKVTWTIENSEDDKSETITASSDTSLVPIGTVIAAGDTLTVYKYYSSVPASNVTLTLSSEWSNGATNTDSGTVKTNEFKTDCLPDTTDEKMRICHATESDTNPYTYPEVSVASIITLPNGHKDHEDDIIPPFSYISQGVPGYYPGLNWTPYNEAFLANGCSEPTATPAVPTFTEAVCTQTAGVPGQASYVIPTTTGIKYTVEINDGGFADATAGTYYVAAGTKVEVQAVALTGYVLGTPNYWSKTFAVPDCTVTVTPDPVTFSVLECVEDEPSQPSYTIPSTTGVTYEVRTNVSGGGWSAWTPVTAGTYNVDQDTEVEVRAVAQTDYALTGTTEWSASFGTLDCIVPEAPTFTAQICDGPGDPSQASYTIPATSGVAYEIWDGDSWEPITADVYDVNSFPTAVQIRAVATTGYEFVAGSQTSWTYDFVSAGECVLEAPIDPVVAVDQECFVDDLDTGAYHYESGTITIPATPNVTYSIDGTPTAAGTWDFVPGVYTISAVPDFGYYLTGVPDPWTVEILAGLPCGLETFPVVTVSATFAQTTCTAVGTYTLAVEPAEEAAGVIWTVSGGLPNTVGTHAVNTAGTVTVTAVPAPGYGFGDGIPGSEREWSFDFTALPDDCLPTLALTGTSIATGGVGLAGLLTLGGVLMILAIRREAAPIQD